MGDVFLHVTGYNSNREIIVSEGPVSLCTYCTSLVNICGWTCVGSTYAYSIALAVDENGQNGTLTVSPASNGSTPFYQYMSETQYNNLTQSDLAYYSLPSWVWYENPVNIVRKTGVVSGTYSNAQGAAISSSVVYGVRKHMGPWQNSYANMTSPTNLDQSHCNQNFGWAMSQISEPAGTTPLSCDGTSGGTSDGTTLPNDPTQLPIEFDPCHDAFINYLYTTGDPVPGGDPYVYPPQWWFTGASEYFDCIGAQSGSSSTFWPEEIEVITIAPFIAQSENSLVVLTESNMFSSNGTYVGPELDFNKGLYWISIQFKNSGVKTIFFEVEDDFVDSYDLSSFLSVNIYPVPIQGDEFEMNLQSAATLKFDYFLIDMQGNELFQRKFVIHQGHNRTHNIKVNGSTGIPSGQLVNKFVFEDGSVKTVMTIK